jgi:hypothetical protein
LQAPTGGTLDIALVDEVTGVLRATVTRPELERLARRGCPDHPAQTCDYSVLDRPEPVDRYRPTPAQARFVGTRDRTCRHPGCRSRAAWADLDHVVPHGAGGATDCANLCCLCRRHHRLKTHARGWRFALCPDGVLSVTTPSGITRLTPSTGHGATVGHRCASEAGDRRSTALLSPVGLAQPAIREERPTARAARTTPRGETGGAPAARASRR